MRTRSIVATTVISAALFTAACPGNVVHTYRTFDGAVDRGASCAELFDQRSRFTDTATLARIDQTLDRIGCKSRDATRTDR